MDDFSCTFKVTFIIHTDADPSEVLDQALEAAKSFADYCDGETDEDDVCVAHVQEKVAAPRIIIGTIV